MKHKGVLLLCLILLPTRIVVTFPSNPDVSGPSTTHQQPTSTSPYVTTFQLAKFSLSGPIPWVLDPQNEKTVWVVLVAFGPPLYSQIINFTLGAQPKVVLNVTNSAVSSIVVDRKMGRVYFPFNDTLAYYDMTSGKEQIATQFPGGSPQFIALDAKGRVWTTLAGSNQVGGFDPSTGKSRNSIVPTPRSVLQGIASAPDGTIWFAEASSKKLGRVDPSTGNIVEYSSPLRLQAPIQLTVGADGLVWFTDHGSNEFGSFNPATGEWRKLPIGYCPGSYCQLGLPNAITTDASGKVWFSEHLAGRVARYDPERGELTEYAVPYPPGTSSSSLAYTWWARPGPGNLTWFTSFGLGVVGYVNASVPVPFSISGVTEATVPVGGSTNTAVTLAYKGYGTVSVGVSSSYLDYDQQTPMLYGSYIQRASVGPNPSRLVEAISAGWGLSKGLHYVMVTASDGQISASFPIRIIVLDNLAPYETLALDSVMLIVGVILFLRPQRGPKDRVL